MACYQKANGMQGTEKLCLIGSCKWELLFDMQISPHFQFRRKHRIRDYESQEF